MRPMKSHKLLFAVLCGFVFASFSAPARAQTFQVLHSFQGWDGASPVAPVILDNRGNIYGTTIAGGATSVRGASRCTSEGCGTVFVMNEAGREIALHSFEGADGAYPFAGILRDSRGNLFGTTSQGGRTPRACNRQGCGVAFRFSAEGKKIEYDFQGAPDGSDPQPSVVEDSAGNLYGTTFYGGKNGLGTVFKIDMATGKETVLYSFTGGTDGCYPYGVILDSAGNLYGVAYEGGNALCDSGDGLVFELDSAGNETVLYTFGGADGANPSSVLMFDSAGDLYGTTQGGGSSDWGTVFELSPGQGGRWSERVLHSFCSLPECADGVVASGGPLVMDGSGNIYGTTSLGGQDGDQGVAFKLDPAGNETVLHSFTGGSDGGSPYAGLAIDSLGNLYGTTYTGGTPCYVIYTCGVVFKITP